MKYGIISDSLYLVKFVYVIYHIHYGGGGVALIELITEFVKSNLDA